MIYYHSSRKLNLINNNVKTTSNNKIFILNYNRFGYLIYLNKVYSDIHFNHHNTINTVNTVSHTDKYHDSELVNKLKEKFVVNFAETMLPQRVYHVTIRKKFLFSVRFSLSYNYGITNRS